MNYLTDQIQIQVNEKIYLKDPNSSELGKKIIGKGIELIDEIGLENFTLRKLARALETTESSIYRYFENKQNLLLYLTSWYWGWLEYQLVFAINNLPTSEEQLRTALRVLGRDEFDNQSIGHINLRTINRIVISESSKSYLTKEVDEANKVGFYSGYKRLVTRISQIVLEINPNFNHAHTLISTIVEGIHHQKYFAEHLPTLTDFRQNTDDLTDFYTDMALAIIKKDK